MGTKHENYVIFDTLQKEFEKSMHVFDGNSHTLTRRNILNYKLMRQPSLVDNLHNGWI